MGINVCGHPSARKPVETISSIGRMAFVDKPVAWGIEGLRFRPQLSQILLYCTEQVISLPHRVSSKRRGEGNQ